MLFAEEPKATLQSLAELPDEELAKIDMGVLNLMSAEGLPGSEALDVEEASRAIARITATVRMNTERYLYMYRRQPKEFRNMEGYFRMQMLVTVVMQDFGAVYNPVRDSNPENPEPAKSFYADAKDVFVNGFVDCDPPTGTCASFPVLYTTIARRLGYPVKLVTTKRHLFCRWESPDGKEVFNIEGTNRGMSSHPDSYYQTFPTPHSPEEAKENGYLKSLNPREELACFVTTRGICLQVSERTVEAEEAYKMAVKLAPKIVFYQKLLANIKCNYSGLFDRRQGGDP